MFETLNERCTSVYSCVKLGAFRTFGTLISVDIVLLLGRAGSLPGYARILGGLREDFLQGVGKLTRFGKLLERCWNDPCLL